MNKPREYRKYYDLGKSGIEVVEEIDENDNIIQFTNGKLSKDENSNERARRMARNKQ